MKFCKNCGKELLDEAVICPNCETRTGEGEQPKPIKEKTHMDAKKIAMMVGLAVVLVVVILVGIIVWNHIRTEQVKEQLAGNMFSYLDDSLYSASYFYYDFDDDANCTYYYYYPNIMDDGIEYERSYEVKFKNGRVFLVFSSDILEVRYDGYGEIECLYDIDTKEIYD